MRTLYFDCFAGASGNMILGSLLDAGVDRDELIRQIGRLGLSGYSVESTKVDRSGISSTHVNVTIPEETGHRHLRHIVEIIEKSELPESVKERAIAIFTRLAEAEAKVHGIDVQKVHFHEVGAMDAIIDVVGSCIGFEMLGIERFACSKIHVGSGFVNMEHGKFPIPPPAVAELLADIPIFSTEIEGELITPTGAAIISTVCDSYGRLPEMRVEQTGYGAGTRTYQGFPNTLRVLIGESVESPETFESGQTTNETERLLLLETNLDDISPQVLGFVMERAFEIGALDCWFTPIQMKKNRPATMLSVLCGPGKRESLTEMLYSETTTLGIRVLEVERESIAREIVLVKTSYGEIAVKIASINGRITNIMPEYDQVASAAKAQNVPFSTVRDAAIAGAEKLKSAAAQY